MIHTANGVNDALIAEERAPAVQRIQDLLDGVATELDKVAADNDLRSRSTAELEKLRATAAAASSIPHIAQACQTADGAYDRALAAIEKAMAPPAPKPGEGAPPTSSTPKVKKRRVVDARSLCPAPSSKLRKTWRPSSRSSERSWRPPLTPTSGSRSSEPSRMNTSELSKYAPEARRSFIAAVSAQAAKLGITAKGIVPRPRWRATCC